MTEKYISTAMFSIKQFLALVTFALFSVAMTAPLAREANDFTSVEASDSIVDIFERGLFNPQCNGIDTVLSSIRTSAKAISTDINTVISAISSNRQNKQQLSEQVVTLLGGILAKAKDLATQLLKVKWTCVTFTLIPGVALTFVSLLSDVVRLLLQIVTYVIVTKIAISTNVWNTILAIPATLIKAFEDVSRSSGLLGIALGALLGQLRNLISTLLPNCSQCANPLA